MKYNLVNFCELDKYAVQSYCAIHNVDESLNLGDITKINEKEIYDFNMMTWGFPCTDISLAGKQKGFVDTDGEKTRSGLYYDGIRILREKQPYISIIENVKNLTSKKFKVEFEQILADLEDAGYNSYWQILNAKNYGIPQNRERIFIVSIRKDVDNCKFQFPKGFDNGIRLNNILEDNVDEKFYISQDKVDKIINLKFMQERLRVQDPNCVPTVNVIGKINSSQDGVIVSPYGISPTHTSGHGNCPKILENTNQMTSIRNDKGLRFVNYTVCESIRTINSGRDKRGFESVTKIVYDDFNERIKSDQSCVNTILTKHCPHYNSRIIEKEYDCTNFRIRKLTPKECFRLMGFSDEDFNKAKYRSKISSEEILKNHLNHKGKRVMEYGERIERMSNSQLYKQAGNSIVVDVMFYIFLELYKAVPNIVEDIKLGSFFSGIGSPEAALKRLTKYIEDNNENFTQVQED